MKFFLGKILLRLLSWIPLPVLHVLAVPFGAILARLPWRKLTIVRTNLALCFPELDESRRERLFRRNMHSLAQLVLEAGAVWHWPREKLMAHVPEVEGLEQLRQAIDSERGVIIAGAHMANWEMLNLYCATLAPMIALYRAPADPGIDAFITGTRQRTGADLIPSGSSAMRRMVRQLKNGGLIGILCDHQPKQGEGVFAPFFGIPALTMTLVTRLSNRTGCAVFMVNAERLPRGRGWRMRFEPAPAAIADSDPMTGTTALNQAVEKQVRRAPHDYLWLYKRFGIRPAGEPELYARRQEPANGRD